jgi:Phosphoglucomutase/phosphomannomutase, alpha/beta/alpha domain I
MLVDLARLEREYYECRPDLDDPEQRVSFGTSGHRGSPSHGSFTEAHILAITQAICDYRRTQGTDGPLYMGKDTHALSGPAQRTALEVLAANGVQTSIHLARDPGLQPLTRSASRRRHCRYPIPHMRALMTAPLSADVLVLAQIEAAQRWAAFCNVISG